MTATTERRIRAEGHVGKPRPAKVRKSATPAFRSPPTAVGVEFFGSRIDWLMGRRNIKQSQLARMAGVTQPALSNFVTDKTRKPSSLTLLGLCRALECDPYWLLLGETASCDYSHTTRSEEMELLRLYRANSAPRRALILGLAVELAASHPGLAGLLPD
jgi:transcriptional regulator with XRE-family HTH domain